MAALKIQPMPYREHFFARCKTCGWRIESGNMDESREGFVGIMDPVTARAMTKAIEHAKEEGHSVLYSVTFHGFMADMGEKQEMEPLEPMGWLRY